MSGGHNGNAVGNDVTDYRKVYDPAFFRDKIKALADTSGFSYSHLPLILL